MTLIPLHRPYGEESESQKFLSAAQINIDSNEIKLHFATNQGSDPLLAFYEGRFKAWQEEQNRQNFQLTYVLGLIQLENRALWLYTGIYKVLKVIQGNHTAWQYETELVTGQDEIIERLINNYEKPFRNSYPKFSTCEQDIRVVELKRAKVSISSFPGYKNVLLKKQELDIVFSQKLESWQSALSSVSGIYVIVDRSSGKQYIGSAYGEGGIWPRWND